MPATGSVEQTRAELFAIEQGISLNGAVFARGGKEPETVRPPSATGVHPMAAPSVIDRPTASSATLSETRAPATTRARISRLS